MSNLEKSHTFFISLKKKHICAILMKYYVFDWMDILKYFSIFFAGKLPKVSTHAHLLVAIGYHRKPLLDTRCRDMSLERSTFISLYHWSRYINYPTYIMSTAYHYEGLRKTRILERKRQAQMNVPLSHSQPQVCCESSVNCSSNKQNQWWSILYLYKSNTI